MSAPDSIPTRSSDLTATRDSGLDLRSLADDVVEGRRSLDNVIDQIVVATPDDRERRRSVAELQSRILALTGARADAGAMPGPPTDADSSPDDPDPMARPPRISTRLCRLAGRPTLAVGLIVVLLALAAALVGGLGFAGWVAGN